MVCAVLFIVLIIALVVNVPVGIAIGVSSLAAVLADGRIKFHLYRAAVGDQRRIHFR